MSSNNNSERQQSERESRAASHRLEPNREQRNEGDLQEQLTITRLLRQLIENGEVRVVSSDNQYGFVSDEESDDQWFSQHGGTTGDGDYFCPCPPTMRTRHEKQPRTVHPSQIKNSDIAIEVSRRCAPSADRCSVLAMLRQREVGMPLGRHRPLQPQIACNFSAAEKRCLTSRFLPNKRRIVDRHGTKTFCCQYTANGMKLLTASQDRAIRFYERSGYRQSYSLQKTIRAPNVGWSILDLAVSPDGRHVVYGTWNDYIHQCNIVSEEPSWEAFNLEPPDYRFCVFSLRFSESGEEILAGASDRCLYVYNREVKRNMLKLDAHDDDINAVCFGDEGSKIIYSAGDDGLCKVWDRRALSEQHPEPVGILAGHWDGITYIDSKGDGRYLLTNSKDQSIKLWDIRKFSNNQAQEATKQAVTKQSWDYRWQSVPRNARNYKTLDGDTSVLTYRGHTVLHTLIRAYFSPLETTGQRYIYTGCATGACIIYDLLTGEIVSRLGGHRGCVRDVTWHPTDNEIVTTSWDGSVAAWRWDERRRRNINPDVPFVVGSSADEQLGDEDSCDDEGRSVARGDKALKRRKRRADKQSSQSSDGARSRSRRGRWFLRHLISNGDSSDDTS